MEQPSSNLAQLYEDSAEMVRSWDGIKTGSTNLQHLLRFNGVSLWDVVAPSLAVYAVPQALSLSTGEKLSVNESIMRRLKPYLRCLRDWLRELQEKRQPPYHFLSSGGEITRILFLSFEPRQIEAMAPVMNLEPLTEESVQIVVLGTKYQPGKHQFLAHKNRRYIQVENLFHGEIARHVGENRRWLRVTWHGLLQDKSFREELKYQGIPLWRYLKDDFLDLSLHTFPQLVKLLSLAELVITTQKPDIVVGADDCDPRARAFFLVAKKLGVPTLHIQYGMASTLSVNWKFMSTDKAAIFDDSTYQTLTRMGLTGHNLVITGPPRFDRPVNRESTRKNICSWLKIDPSSKIILFTSQPNVCHSFPSEAIRKQLISNIYYSAAGLPNTILVVKPHPDEDTHLHYQLRAKVSPSTIRVVGNDFDTQELILASDALVSFTSTTLLEAIIADRPVVMVKIPGSSISVQYHQTVPGLVAKSQEELSSALKAIFSDKGVRDKLQAMRQAFLAQQRYLDGKASQRVADLIFSMIAENRQREPPRGLFGKGKG